MESEKPLTYQDFLRMQLKDYAKNPIDEQEKEDEARALEIIDNKKESDKSLQKIQKQQQQQSPPDQVSSSFLTNLCRICGSPGTISIHSTPTEFLLCFKSSQGSKKNVSTIAEMVTQISGETIDKNDLLPQFVCSHCLGYLQHAYNIRNQIIETNKNFKYVLEVQSQEGNIPLQLSPSTQQPSVSTNQREILKQKEDLEQEKYWNEVIEKNTNKIKIKIPPRVRKPERLFEHKCVNCNKRVYSIKSLNQHMAVCIITQLATFFSDLKQLYANKISLKITSIEYQISALSLIYNTNKNLRKIAKDQKLHLNSIIDYSSEFDQSNTPQSISTTISNRSQFRFYSPDNGYNSGYTS